MLKPLLETVLGWFDLRLVRASTFEQDRPTWQARLLHAKRLGFEPAVVYDCGAFDGCWTKRCARLFPGAHFVLFEPNRYMLDKIRGNVTDLRPSPIVLNKAVGAHPGAARLNLWQRADEADGASLLGHVSGEAAEALSVEVVTLDQAAADLDQAPDLIKLDLQGAEHRAIEGATHALARTEMVIVEFGCLDAYLDRATPLDLMRLLYQRNFRLYDIVDCHYRPYDGALTGGDFVFVAKDSPLLAYKAWS